MHNIKIFEKKDNFKKINKNFQYANTLIIYCFVNNVFYAITKSRCQFTAKINTKDFLNMVLIPTASYYPYFLSNFTQVPNLLSSNYYIKHLLFLLYIIKIHSLFIPNEKTL